jgi:hypothetical protein
MRNLPFRTVDHIPVWLQSVARAHAIICSTLRLLLTGELDKAGPKRLRYRPAGRLDKPRRRPPPTANNTDRGH